VRKGVRLIYIPGKRDEFLKNYLGLHFGGVEVVESAIHLGADGRRHLVAHGDAFDVVVRHARWLALFGDWAYETALTVNTGLNAVRRRLGLTYWSLSQWAKLKVKGAVNFIGDYEQALVTEARRNKVDGIICGHIHHAVIHDRLGLRYMNCGDWVESCTALVETYPAGDPGRLGDPPPHRGEPRRRHPHRHRGPDRAQGEVLLPAAWNPFTTSYSTKFPEYISARFGVPESWSYWLLRRFHAASRVTMASTSSLLRELRQRGFRKLGLWTRGVDTELFSPWPKAPLDLPRPIFMNVGRIAIEKNLDAFLSLDLPGSKVIIGEGPQQAELQRRFPRTHFLGVLRGPELATHLAAADVFVFPSKTDTYGVVQLEALSCGVPGAAFPVTGPRDVIGDSKAGVLDNDLRAACLGALQLPREACRELALACSWDTSTRQFIRNVGRALVPGSEHARISLPG
jgi:glycosyltransferase involved in cell wall biosynthesis